MPGSTIHIMFAHMLEPEASDRYFAGCVAPDAVEDYHIKDKTHFRKIPDRAARIAAFIRGLPDNDWCRGMMTHLYLDWRWDMCELERFIALHGEGWFRPYREDISRLSRYFSHRFAYCGDIWRRIYELPIGEYGVVPEADSAAVREFITAGYRSSQQPSEPPRLFMPDEAERFLEMAALEYPRFLKSFAGGQRPAKE